MGGRSGGTARTGPGALRACTALPALIALTLAWCAQPAGAATHRRKPHHHGKKPAAAVRCKPGEARLQAGKRSICVKNQLPVTHLSPQAVQVATALAFELGHLRDTHGRRTPGLATLLRRRGPHTLENLEGTIAAGLARGRELALRAAIGPQAHLAAAPVAFAAVHCGGSPELERARKELEEAPPAQKEKGQQELAAAEKSSSFKSGEAEASVNFENGAIKLGIDTKSKAIHIDVSLRSCGGDGLKIAGCPTAQGVLEGHDTQELEVTFKVTEGGKLLLSQGLKFAGETTIKAQTGDDAKLDYYDVKHVYRLVGSFGGSKSAFGPVTIDETYIGEAHVDMRSGSQQAPPAQVDVMITMAGADPAERIAAEIKLARETQSQADKEFSAEVDKATSNLRNEEAVWLKPNGCASMQFEPASETLKLQKGQTGTFKSRTEASGGGAPPSATWTLSGQQNATFTPNGSAGNPLSTAYSVTDAGKDKVVSATLKATSRAGVAEATWKQKTEQVINTITGTFSGRFLDNAEVIEWSGSATYTAVEHTVGGGAILKLASGQATVTASGEPTGSGCLQTGTEDSAAVLQLGVDRGGRRRTRLLPGRHAVRLPRSDQRDLERLLRIEQRRPQVEREPRARRAAVGRPYPQRRQRRWSRPPRTARRSTAAPPRTAPAKAKASAGPGR